MKKNRNDAVALIGEQKVQQIEKVHKRFMDYWMDQVYGYVIGTCREDLDFFNWIQTDQSVFATVVEGYLLLDEEEIELTEELSMKSLWKEIEYREDDENLTESQE
jgi:hypothetical protein